MRKSNLKIQKIKKSKNQKQRSFIIFTFVFLTFVFLAFIFFKVATLEKFIYVNNKNGSAEIIISDPQKEAPIKILIDKDFVLESSRNMGEYKLSSLWILGQKEKIDGLLVTETIVKNFGLPIFLWKDGKSSNLNLYQKIKIFSNNFKSDNYDYLLTSKKPNNSILINFTLSDISSYLPKVQIVDLTGSKNIAEKISSTLEVLGFKTVDYSKGYDEELDCEIVGKTKKYTDLVGKIFNCQSVVEENQSIDLKIRIGKIFTNRY